MVVDLAEVPAGGSSLSFFSSGAADAATAAEATAAITAVMTAAAAAADADLTVSDPCGAD